MSVAVVLALLATLLAAVGLGRARRGSAPSSSEHDQLRHSEEELRRAILEAPLPLFLHTEDGEILLMSHEWLRLSGYTREEIVTVADWRERAYGADAAEITRYVQSLFDEGKGARRELLVQTATGEVRIWEFSASAPGRLWDGRRYFATIVRDVTDARRAEERLYEQQEHLRLAMESAELGTWDLNVVTGVVNWSERGRAMFGLTPDEPVSYEVFLSRVHPDDRERVHQAAQYSLDPSGTGEYGIDYRSRWPDGTVRWITAKGRTFFSGEGENRRPVRFIGTCVDVTDRRPRALPRQRFAPAPRPALRDEPAAAEPAPSANGRERQLHLLVVDCVLHLAPRLVERGYRVSAVETVAAARTLVAAGMPDDDIDLVVSLLALPDGSGLDLMLELASRYGLRGIALAESLDPGDRRRFYEAGFDRHLLLSTEIQDLDAAIRQVTGALQQ